MNRLEQLIHKYSDQLNFHFRSDMPDSLSGLIVGTNVYINSNLSRDEAYVTLAEEIGHYETSSTKKINDYDDPINRKEEIKARRWSYKKLIPIDQLKKYEQSEEQVFLHQISEEIDLPEDIIFNTIKMYEVEGEI